MANGYWLLAFPILPIKPIRPMKNPMKIIKNQKITTQNEKTSANISSSRAISIPLQLQY